LKKASKSQRKSECRSENKRLERERLKRSNRNYHQFKLVHNSEEEITIILYNMLSKGKSLSQDSKNMNNSMSNIFEKSNKIIEIN
jgi:uncharacterized membrane protein YgaE (UPF0421/DUF939 family)